MPFYELIFQVKCRLVQLSIKSAHYFVLIPMAALIALSCFTFQPQCFAAPTALPAPPPQDFAPTNYATEFSEQGFDPGGIMENLEENLLSPLGGFMHLVKDFAKATFDAFIKPIGQVIGSMLALFIKTVMAPFTTYLMSILKWFVINPNIPLALDNGADANNPITGGQINPFSGSSKYDPSLHNMQVLEEQMKTLALDLSLILFVLAIWRQWIEGAFKRAGGGLMGPIGRFIFTMALMLCFREIYKQEINITNEMTQAIFFNTPTEFDLLNSALIDAMMMAIAAGAGLAISAFAPVVGGVVGTAAMGPGVGSAIGGAIGEIIGFVGLVMFAIFGGILIVQLCYLLVLKATQTGMLVGHYIFSPMYLVFYASPDTQHIANAFMGSFVEVSLWTFAWMGLFKIMVIVIASQATWGKLLIVIGLLQIMIQVPKWINTAKINPESHVLDHRLAFNLIKQGFSTISGAVSKAAPQVGDWAQNSRLASVASGRATPLNVNTSSPSAGGPPGPIPFSPPSASPTPGGGGGAGGAAATPGSGAGGAPATPGPGGGGAPGTSGPGASPVVPGGGGAPVTSPPSRTGAGSGTPTTGAAAVPGSDPTTPPGTDGVVIPGLETPAGAGVEEIAEAGTGSEGSEEPPSVEPPVFDFEPPEAPAASEITAPPPDRASSGDDDRAAKRRILGNSASARHKPTGDLAPPRVPDAEPEAEKPRRRRTPASTPEAGAPPLYPTFEPLLTGAPRAELPTPPEPGTPIRRVSRLKQILERAQQDYKLEKGVSMAEGVRNQIRLNEDSSAAVNYVPGAAPRLRAQMFNAAAVASELNKTDEGFKQAGRNSVIGEQVWGRGEGWQGVRSGLITRGISGLRRSSHSGSNALYADTVQGRLDANDRKVQGTLFYTTNGESGENNEVAQYLRNTRGQYDPAAQLGDEQNTEFRTGPAFFAADRIPAVDAMGGYAHYRDQLAMGTYIATAMAAAGRPLGPDDFGPAETFAQSIPWYTVQAALAISSRHNDKPIRDLDYVDTVANLGALPQLGKLPNSRFAIAADALEYNRSILGGSWQQAGDRVRTLIQLGFANDLVNPRIVAAADLVARSGEALTPDAVKEQAKNASVIPRPPAPPLVVPPTGSESS